jgi:glycosyltransferase involved in cell wall biosynthesis
LREAAGNAAPPPAGLRVLVLSRCASEFGASRGGVDVLVRRHATMLADSGAAVIHVGTRAFEHPGVDCVVVATRDIVPVSRLDSHHASVAYLANEGGHVIQGALAAARACRRSQVEVVVSNSSIATLVLKRFFGVGPVIHYIHDGMYEADAGASEGRLTLRYLMNHFLERMAVRAADRVICASQSIASQVTSNGVDPSRVTVMYPLLAARRTEASDPTRSSPFPELWKPFILSVGQQTGRKRFDLLIRAMHYVPEPFRLVLVGDGPMHEVYRLNAIEEGLSSRVMFLKDVSDGTLERMYRACDAYALASENEGFPITVAEALTAGCRVVLACPPSWKLDRVIPSTFVRLVSDMQEESVGLALREVALRQDAQVSREDVREWALKQFPTTEGLTEKYRGIFRSLLPKPSPEAPPESAGRSGTPLVGVHYPRETALGPAGPAAPSWLKN